MHHVLPQQRCQNHSETIIKAVKIHVRKGLVVSCSHYHTRWEWSLFVPFFPGISITVCITPLENGEIRASYRAPERSTQLNKDQGDPAGIPATSLSEADTAEHWRVEERQKNCTSSSKNPNTEVLMWQKELDRRSQQWASTARFPAQPLHLPSSAGLGSTPSSKITS